VDDELSNDDWYTDDGAGFRGATGSRVKMSFFKAATKSPIIMGLTVDNTTTQSKTLNAPLLKSNYSRRR